MARLSSHSIPVGVDAQRLHQPGLGGRVKLASIPGQPVWKFEKMAFKYQVPPFGPFQKAKLKPYCANGYLFARLI